MTVRQADAGRLWFQHVFTADGSGGGWTTAFSLDLSNFPQLDPTENAALYYTLMSCVPSFSGGVAEETKSVIQYRPAPTLFTFGTPATIYTAGSNYQSRVEAPASSGHAAINVQVNQSPPTAGVKVYLYLDVHVVRGLTVIPP